eukprot:721203-Pyramimonas_sp.AAC.1
MPPIGVPPGRLVSTDQQPSLVTGLQAFPKAFFQATCWRVPPACGRGAHDRKAPGGRRRHKPGGVGQVGRHRRSEGSTLQQLARRRSIDPPGHFDSHTRWLERARDRVLPSAPPYGPGAAQEGSRPVCAHPARLTENPVRRSEIHTFYMHPCMRRCDRHPTKAHRHT